MWRRRRRFEPSESLELLPAHDGRNRVTVIANHNGPARLSDLGDDRIQMALDVRDGLREDQVLVFNDSRSGS